MTFYEILLLLTGGAGLLAPLTFLYAKLIKPIKKIETMEKELKDAQETRVITTKSLVAILEALEKSGANGSVTTTKKELITHMAKRTGGKSERD